MAVREQRELVERSKLQRSEYLEFCYGSRESRPINKFDNTLFYLIPEDLRMKAFWQSSGHPHSWTFAPVVSYQCSWKRSTCRWKSFNDLGESLKLNVGLYPHIFFSLTERFQTLVDTVHGRMNETIDRCNALVLNWPKFTLNQEKKPHCLEIPCSAFYFKAMIFTLFPPPAPVGKNLELSVKGIRWPFLITYHRSRHQSSQKVLILGVEFLTALYCDYLPVSLSFCLLL